MGNNINSENSQVNKFSFQRTEKKSSFSNDLTEKSKKNKAQQISILDTTNDSSNTNKESKNEEKSHKNQKNQNKQTYKKVFEWKGNGGEIYFKSNFVNNFNSNMIMKQVEKETFQYEALLEEGTYFFYFLVDGQRKLSDYYLKKVLSDGKECNMIIINAKSFSNELLSVNSQPPLLAKDYISPIDTSKVIFNSQLDHIIINDLSINQVNDNENLYISSVSQRIRHKKMQIIYYSYFNLEDKCT